MLYGIKFVYLSAKPSLKNWEMNETNLKSTRDKELIKSKISLQECKAILNKNGENFSNEEVKEIRDFLYALIEIDYHHFQKHMREKAEQLMEAGENKTEVKVIPLNTNENTDTNEFRQAG